VNAEPGMQHRRNVSLVLGLLVGCLGYLACVVFSPPVLCYLPELQQWSFEAPPDRIAMRYYGMPQWGVGGFFIGFVIGRVPAVAARFEQSLAARILVRLTAALLCGSLLWFLVKELAHWSAR
jgi:hypothetical protein